MSGRAKNAAADPAAELREIVRQAHEAARDTRAALAELRAERAAAEKAVYRIVNEQITKAQEHIDAQADRIAGEWQQALNACLDRHAAFLGAANEADLLSALTSRLFPDIREAVRETIIRRLPELTARTIIAEARLEISRQLGLGRNQ